MDLFDLVAKITLDSSEYEKGISNSQSSAKTWGSSLAKAGKVGIAAITATTAAVVAFGVGLTKSVNSVADYGDKVDKMSQKIGISTDAYQKWDYVMQRAGTNVDNLKMGMKTLSQQAEKGSDAFQKLGISQEEVAKLSQEDLFEKTVKGLADMEAGTERTVLATQLLGRAGADLAPLLNQGSEAIEEQMKIAEKYGMVMPEETVKASAAFKDSVTTMQMTMTGLKNRMMGEFLPAFTQVTDGLALLFTGDMSGMDDIEAGLDGIIGKIDQMLPKVMEIGGKIVQTIAMSIIEDLPELTTSAVSILTEIVESITDNLPVITESATLILVSLVKGISESLPTLIPAMVEAVMMMVTTLIENVDLLVDAATQLIGGLVQGLIQAIPIILENLPQILYAIFNAFIGFDWLSLGKQILTAIIDGILSLGESMSSSLRSIGEKAWRNLRNIDWAGLGSAIVGFIKNGIIALAYLPVQALKDVGSSAMNAFSNLNWSNLGHNIIQGVVRGVQAAASSLVSTMTNLASQALQAAKNALGISSPSKVFKNQVGKNIVLGMAAGIEDNLGIVYDASEAMADATMFTPKTPQLADGTASIDANSEAMAVMIGEIVGEYVAEALEDMNIILDRRSMGKFTRQSVGATI